DRDEPEGDRSRSDRMRWHRHALPARKSRRDEAFCTVSRGPLCFKAHGPAPTTWGRRPGEDHSLVINERPPRLPAPRRSPAPARPVESSGPGAGELPARLRGLATPRAEVPAREQGLMLATLATRPPEG